MKLDPALNAFRFFAAERCLALSAFPRCQEVGDDFWAPPATLWAVVFISHRWESDSHPDPGGHQLGTLKIVFEELSRLMKSLEKPPPESDSSPTRPPSRPTLARHGTLQASLLLLRALWHAPEETVATTDWTAADLLARIGVWYDYTCLPQVPRSTVEDAGLVQALTHMGQLLNLEQVTLLALRSEGDQYLSRAWCLAEAAASRAAGGVDDPLVLRTDRLGQPVDGLPAQHVTALRLWENADKHAAPFSLLTDALRPLVLEPWDESTENTPSLYLGRSSAHGRALRLSAAATAELTVILSTEDEARLDVLLPPLLQAHGLLCTQRYDQTLVALLILSSTVAAKATGLAALWREGLSRYLRGEPLAVRAGDRLSHATWA